MGKENRSRKHVSKACLQCRNKHTKCDGLQPVCKNCSDQQRTCTYVESHRGGKRRKGEKSQSLSKSDDGPSSSLEVDCETSNMDLNTPQNLEPLFTWTPIPPPPALAWASSVEESTEANTPRPANLLSAVDTRHLERELSLSDIPKEAYSYYMSFHRCHPILPPIVDAPLYFKAIGENSQLLEVLDLLHVVLTDTSRSSEATVRRGVHHMVGKIIQYPIENLARLQALTLLAIICYSYAMADITFKIKSMATSLCSILNSQYSIMRKITSPEDAMLVVGYQRTSHELYTINSIIGASVPHSFDSLLAVFEDMLEHIPITDPPLFSFNTRYQAMKILRSVSVHAYFSEKNEAEISQLQATTATWQQYLLDPAMIGAPPLIDHKDNVNHGILQAIASINFASLLLHIPHSTLSDKDGVAMDSASNQTDLGNGNANPSMAGGKPMEGTNEQKHEIPPPSGNSRKVLHSRKAIAAANNIAQLLSDIGLSKVQTCSPLISSSIAMSLLVHIKALLRILAENSTESRYDDILLYQSYIELETRALELLGRLWVLPKLINMKLKDYMALSLPVLHRQIFQPVRAAKSGALELPVSFVSPDDIMRSQGIEDVSVDSIIGNLFRL